jgi:hypothetical protein
MRRRGLQLALRVLDWEHEALWSRPEIVGLSAPHSQVPFTAQVAYRVHRLREDRLDGTAALWELDFAQPWFVVAARSQALVLLFSRSGALAAAGFLTREGFIWDQPASRNWF